MESKQLLREVEDPYRSLVGVPHMLKLDHAVSIDCYPESGQQSNFTLRGKRGRTAEETYFCRSISQARKIPQYRQLFFMTRNAESILVAMNY